MYNNEIKDILKKIKNNEIKVDKAMDKLKDLPFEDLGYAKVDHHRAIRNNHAEVIYCEGKTVEEIKGIVEKMYNKGSNILASRADENIGNIIKSLYSEAVYHKRAGLVTIKQKPIELSNSKVLVISGGTSDLEVAEEAAITSEFLGSKTERLYDVGVAGIHRLLSHRKEIASANVLIVVAGMEGALPSVVSGFSNKPIIAVPTSIGYGANFEGLAALLAMLNSCASGLSVVNIDNGFGAAYAANMIINQIEMAVEGNNNG